MSTEATEPIDWQKYFWPPVLVLCLNACLLAAFFFFKGPLVAAKVLFIEVTVTLALLCLAIAVFHHLIMNMLEELAIFAEDRRVETLFEMRRGREQLSMIARRLENTMRGAEVERPVEDLLHHAMPLVQILLSKEKNWIQLGMFGFRLAKDAMRLFNPKR